MEAITIRQPWASLIVHGIKDIENLAWPCPKKYIGQRVLIHASTTSWTWHQVVNYLIKPMKDVFIKLGYNEAWLRELPTGEIIGSVEIVSCVLNHPSIWAEKGVYNWVLANPVLYERPIENVKGSFFFWDYLRVEEVKIECPECGSIEIAVEDHTTEPFSTYFHSCNKCGHIIMESEWNRV